MIERGMIVGFKDGQTVVRLKKNINCAGCRLCGFKKGQDYVDVNADNELGGEIGDTVEVESAKDNSLKAALLAYILPLILGAIGVVIGYFTVGEWLAVLLCIVMVSVGFLINSFIDKKLSKNKNFRIKVIKLIRGGEKNE